MPYSPQNVELRLSAFPPAVRRPVVARMRAALGDGPHAVDPDLQARLAAATMLEQVHGRGRRVSYRFLAAVEHASQLVWVGDDQAFTVACSQRFATTLGYPDAAQLRGTSGRLLVTEPANAEKLLAGGGGVQQAKTVLRHRNGLAIPCRCRVTAAKAAGLRLSLATLEPL